MHKHRAKAKYHTQAISARVLRRRDAVTNETRIHRTRTTKGVKAKAETAIGSYLADWEDTDLGAEDARNEHKLGALDEFKRINATVYWESLRDGHQRLANTQRSDACFHRDHARGMETIATQNTESHESKIILMEQFLATLRIEYETMVGQYALQVKKHVAAADKAFASAELHMSDQKRCIEMLADLN